MLVEFSPSQSLDPRFIPTAWNQIRGVYIIYSTLTAFQYPTGGNDIAYIGKGLIGRRLFSHANGEADGNAKLFDLLQLHRRGNGYLRLVWGDCGDDLGARTVEAILLKHFEKVYGAPPCCNQVVEAVPSKMRVEWSRSIIDERHQEPARRARL